MSQTTTVRISTVFAGLDWLESDFLRPTFSVPFVFSQGSDWPLFSWPNSKVILSSPIWQRGSRSGIHSITKGPASFCSAVPGPGRDTALWTFAALKKKKEKRVERQTLTDFEESAELHGPNGLRTIASVSFWFNLRLGTLKTWIRAISVFHKTLMQLKRHLVGRQRSGEKY